MIHTIVDTLLLDNTRTDILEILSFISPLLEISRERERRIIEIAKAE